VQKGERKTYPFRQVRGGGTNEKDDSSSHSEKDRLWAEVTKEGKEGVWGVVIEVATEKKKNERKERIIRRNRNDQPPLEEVG